MLKDHGPAAPVNARNDILKDPVALGGGALSPDVSGVDIPVEILDPQVRHIGGQPRHDPRIKLTDRVGTAAGKTADDRVLAGLLQNQIPHPAENILRFLWKELFLANKDHHSRRRGFGICF